MKFGVNIIKGYEKAISLYCSYVKMEGQGIIMYTIMPAEDKRVTSIVMDISEEDIEEATINNNLYYIYTDEEKARIAVYWETEEFMYSIDGNITEEEAIRIVESIE